MLKKGFTLQEAMITLAIIGIVAAITVPRLAKLAPDENHAKYLKAHALLTDITNEILVDPALYFCSDGTEGLSCTNMPKQGAIPQGLYAALNNINPLTPLDKYFEIFAYKMHIQDTYRIDGDARAFRAKDGIVWIFQQLLDNNNSDFIAVDIDMNGIGNNDRLHVDRFAFNVDLDGTVNAADAMGQFYLENASNVNHKNTEKSQSLQLNNDRYRQMLRVSQACADNVGYGICYRY